MKLAPYHSMLSQALDAAIEYLKDQKAEFNETDLRDVYAYDGINYGHHKSANVEINLYKGKPTKKWAHMTIWRHDSGRYEVNAYIL